MIQIVEEKKRGFVYSLQKDKEEGLDGERH
jgi:hypothetical protein